MSNMFAHKSAYDKKKISDEDLNTAIRRLFYFRYINWICHSVHSNGAHDLQNGTWNV